MHMQFIGDLSEKRHLISDLFHWPKTIGEWDAYRLTDEQVKHFHEEGYVSGIKLLDEDQVDFLNQELEELTNPEHPGHHLFYEFHTNESNDPNSVLFHSLGHWRITKGFHDKTCVYTRQFKAKERPIVQNRQEGQSIL